jgi:hypothetical protein
VDEALLDSEKRYKGLLDNLEAELVVHGAIGKILMCTAKQHNYRFLMITGKDADDSILQFTMKMDLSDDQDYPVSKF